MVRSVPGSPGLIQACDDPRLLAVPLWPVERVFLTSAEVHKLTVLCCGRRVGKTTSGATVLCWDAALRPHLDRMVLPGEGRHSVAVATSLRQARLLVTSSLAILERSPLLSSLIANVTDDSITLTNGNTISAFPCGSRSARGWAISALVFDELAHFVDSEGNAAAEGMWRALAPATLQFGSEGRIVCCSTPSGSGGFFAQLYGQVEAGEIEGKAHHFSTAEANPTVDPAFLEAERAALGEEGFRQEYGGEFISGSGSFFDHDEIRAVVSGKGALPEDGRGWVCSIDPASGTGDPFGLCVCGHDARPGFEGRLLVGHVERWLPRKGGRLSRRSRGERDLWIDSVLDKVAQISKRYGASVVSDQHVPHVITDELRKRGVSRVRIAPWTASTRSEAFQSLRLRVSTERISIPDDEQLVAEMLRVRTRFRAGASVIELPRVGDSHCDVVTALAAGVRQLDNRGADSPMHTVSAFDLPTPGGIPRRVWHTGQQAQALRDLGLSGEPPRTRGTSGTWLEQRRGWGR